MNQSTTAAIKKFDLIIIGLSFIGLTFFLNLQRTTDFIIFCIFVVSYDLLYGYMGRLSFGHMLYFGVGAYSAALFAEHWSENPFASIGFALLCGAAIGLLLGPIIVRTTGACFALINLAFNQVGYFLVLIGLAGITGGEDGKSAHFSNIGPISFSNKMVVFVLSLAFLLIVAFIVKHLTKSPFGTLIRSIKENEGRAKFLGYPTVRYKLLTFTISTMIAALAGALSAINYAYVTPSFIDTSRNVEVIFAGLIGGAGSLYGALIGGVTYMMISNFLPNYIQRWEMFLGIALLILVFRFRSGIWGYIIGLSGRKETEVAR